MTSSEIQKLTEELNAGVIETHISWVLITKDKVYKIKKPVKNSFLDFSTLTLRKYYCEEEVRLNKVLEPEIYERIIAITFWKGKVCLSQEGYMLLDYAVQMKRMDNTKELQVLLSTDNVDPADIRKLSRRVADFHKKALIYSDVKDPEKRIREYEDILNYQNEMSTVLSQKEIIRIKECCQRINHFLNEKSSVFEQRSKDGYVRDVHGDLHCGNIILSDEPILFDRIEFNPSFRRIDVLHETAFLCMDLEFHKRKDLSQEFFNNYTEATGWHLNKEELLLFHYYKSYCANIRAKVTLLDSGARQINQEVIKKYLDLMFFYEATLQN